MNKRLLLLSYSLFVVFGLQAQVHFFVEASGNMSLIPKSEKTVSSSSIPEGANYTAYSIYNYKEDYDNALGTNVVMGIQYDLKNKFSFESGLDLSLIKFNHDLLLSHAFMYIALNNSNSQIPLHSVSYYELKSNFSLTYLSIPISVFYRLFEDKLYVGAGVLPGVLVSASNDYNDNSIISKLSIAAQLQVRYKMTEKISVVTAFQQYLSPIFKEDFSPNKTKNRLVKLGLRYDI
ncbi:hypothetical protein Palpr_0657 [Paludibacter propionicigenes WB4]|uniref:Outer membrane protein beta-barrel domain-containing protein n=1 Tax=Paludibacter propionicigenes (strain DSM 17365 / JCM 13257 / WB4) TaxID=694427 RepID=E4T269_PALPW|nr:outer membrane beta-barrel protein [Paludibacter propionicigenes]ADQ78813.1 hypothetical protein Palpr_0657 [Paludibacter propionicigenes WB4]